MNHDPDRDLDDLLGDDGGRFGGLYRRLPRYEPPRRLDRAVLGEAARAVHSGKPPRRQRWIVGVGSAAGLVLAAGIAWRIGHDRDESERRSLLPRRSSCRCSRSASPRAPSASEPAQPQARDRQPMPQRRRNRARRTRPRARRRKTRSSRAPHKSRAASKPAAAAEPPKPAAAHRQQHRRPRRSRRRTRPRRGEGCRKIRRVRRRTGDGAAWPPARIAPATDKKASAEGRRTRSRVADDAERIGRAAPRHAARARRVALAHPPAQAPGPAPAGDREPAPVRARASGLDDSRRSATAARLSAARLDVTALRASRETSHERPVVLELGDRIAHVAQRRVRRFLREAAAEIGRPAPRQLLDRRHIEIAIVEIALQPRHQPMQEPAILADRIAAHRRLAGRHPLREEFDGQRFGGRDVDRRIRRTRCQRPDLRCWLRFQSSIASSRSSGWRSANSGPSASWLRSLSVTIVAISRIES